VSPAASESGDAGRPAVEEQGAAPCRRSGHAAGSASCVNRGRPCDGVLRLVRSAARCSALACLQRHFTTKLKESLDAAEAAGVFTYKTIGQGAATSMVAAVAPELAQTGGHYLDDGQEAYTVPDDADLAQQRQAVAARPGHRDPTLDCLDRPSSRLTSSRPERQPELR